ncbi:unnamed protein product [Sphenostylis stenocarpa]|uniref:Uncharacterized protein n=1 Tax=Sphenostylis stenocarpa TaxID=92480 RepID=A0AA86W648_9FABA|nr:unnamed protein product [Sphenostylis stenocarpa]
MSACPIVGDAFTFSGGDDELNAAEMSSRHSFSLVQSIPSSHYSSLSRSPENLSDVLALNESENY